MCTNHVVVKEVCMYNVVDDESDDHKLGTRYDVPIPYQEELRSEKKKREIIFGFRMLTSTYSW